MYKWLIYQIAESNGKNRFDSKNRIESKLFLPELECSSVCVSVSVGHKCYLCLNGWTDMRCRPPPWKGAILGPLWNVGYIQHELIKVSMPSVSSVLWRCWLGGRKGIRPVKNWVVGCWRGYLSGSRFRLAYGPADATATHCLLLHKNPDWCYLSGTGSPG